MTPAEHREEAEAAAEVASESYANGEDRNAAHFRAMAQVHATLALTPAPPPVVPQHKWSLDKPHNFPDATGSALTVMPTADRSGVILSEDSGVLAVLLENPDVLRTLASLLTAHADRLESKP